MSTELEWGDEQSLPAKHFSDIKKFRGKRDKTDRIYVIEKKAVAAWTHYFIRGYFKCLAERTTTSEGAKVNRRTCPICARVAELIKADGNSDTSTWIGAKDRLRIGTNIIYYVTDHKGELLDPFMVETRVWIMDAKKYAALGSIKKEWGDLQNYDIKVQCSDEKYQKMTMLNTKSALCLVGDRKERTLQEYERNKADISKVLCRTLTAEQLVSTVRELEESLLDGDIAPASAAVPNGNGSPAGNSPRTTLAGGTVSVTAPTLVQGATKSGPTVESAELDTLLG